MLYNVEIDEQASLLTVRFGDAGTNAEIVKEVAETLKTMRLPGGPLLRVTGPASLPVAFALAHGVGHLYGAVAVFDPKVARFVVAISHDPALPAGALLR